ncbi:hypothetical protein B566_EDAN014510 [Ephemera danica]|nr:hypothetical protein B566_EDAN014510 [Ephemera danica]
MKVEGLSELEFVRVISMSDGKAVLNAQRTNGDGMENPDSGDLDLLANRTGRLSLGEKFIYRPGSLASCTITAPPAIPHGQLIHLKPKAMPVAATKDAIPKNMKGKEPKFVPYEPYKAAVKPIVPPKKEKTAKRKVKGSKDTDMEIRSLPSLDMLCKSEDSCQFELEKYTLTTEMEALRSQNQELEKQLKFQAQVNTELKSMLVAAVGEDLECRVQHLTEDKLQLARALLSSAQKLSSHQEQLEWLVGQCEVWRSKFLASSLMLEEVARSTATLQKRTLDLQSNLQVLRENFDPASGLTLATSPQWQRSASSSSVNEVAEACQLLSVCLAQRLLGTTAPSCRHSSAVIELTTPAETKAKQLLQKSEEVLGMLPDLACSAVVGAAAVAGGGLFPHISSTPTSCCAHCSGYAIISQMVTLILRFHMDIIPLLYQAVGGSCIPLYCCFI